MTSQPWARLAPDDARRVSRHGNYDFFWLVLSDGNPGLMLRLPEIPDADMKLPKLRNISVEMRATTSGSAFVLGLNERSQLEIFETLCRDIVAAGEAADSLPECLTRTVRRTQRWHYLLKGGRPSGLSLEEQCGLVGELSVLRELVSGLGARLAVDAWKGPVGAQKDFEFPGTCIEVKAHRSAARPAVQISSENQLADVDGSRLFLRIVNLSSAISPEGDTLHDHVQQTEKMFDVGTTAHDIWEQAIYATGYDPEDAYEGRRWRIGTSSTYEVLSDFPRLVPPLPNGIARVRYSLSLEACAPFAFSGDLVGIIQEGMSV